MSGEVRKRSGCGVQPLRAASGHAVPSREPRLFGARHDALCARRGRRGWRTGERPRPRLRGAIVTLPTMAVTRVSGLLVPGPALRSRHVRTVHASERFVLHQRLPVSASVVATPAWSASTTRARVAARWSQASARSSMPPPGSRSPPSARRRSVAAMAGSVVRCSRGATASRSCPVAGHGSRHSDLAPRGADLPSLRRLQPAACRSRDRSGCRLPSPILHGLSTYGYLGRRILTAFRGDTSKTIVMMDCRFTGHVLPATS